jgi:hypothetical protein
MEIASTRPRQSGMLTCMQTTTQGHESLGLAGSTHEPTARQTTPELPSDAAPQPAFDEAAIAEFRAFLQKNKDSLPTGMGAFHTDNHSNW